MRVRMLVTISGSRHDAPRWPRAGEEFDVPDWEGSELCAQGYAQPVAVTDSDKAEKRTTKKTTRTRKTS